MRILIVHYRPDPAGGAESAIRDQAEALKRLGHEVEIEFRRPFAAYNRFQPDVVHFHTVHVGIGINVLKWAQDEGIPHCISVHDYWPFCGPRMLLSHYDQSCAAVAYVCDGKCDGSPRDRRVLDIVNLTPVVAFNPYTAAIYKRHGLRVDRIIPHGIDTEFFAPDYAKRGDTPRIVAVSAWPGYPTKGLHVLQDAVEMAGLKATVISGVTRERVRDELQKADVMVFPSCYEETWGLCLTEAMACGCAVVASDVCGSRAQIMDFETGLLFPNRDREALAACLTLLVEDDELRQRLGRKAREWAAQRFNLARMGRDYLKFYNELIHARPPEHKDVEVQAVPAIAKAQANAGGQDLQEAR